MCLAIPAVVVELLDGDSAVVDLDGVRKQVSLALVEHIAVGDYVIIHVGFALQRLNVDEAEQTLALMRQLGSDALGSASAIGAPP
ncbi:MAG TPA: HypC/HybG/HupF family hydrogenase formation chaperone [Steroidobacteraceae bacterium]|nr:HypC/HybG/HupF family hydrogenase formation chaperone [Steroidobacteraceae bacterium]